MSEAGRELTDLLKRLGRLKAVRLEVIVLPRGMRVSIWRPPDALSPAVFEGDAERLSTLLRHWFGHQGA